MSLARSVILIIVLLVMAYNVRSEDRIKIGIIDTGISLSQATGDYLCENGRKSAIRFDSGLDRNGHGTNVFGLIAKRINPKTHCIISYKFWKKGISGNQSVFNIANSIYEARKDGVKYLNMSLAGPVPNSQEAKQILKAAKEGITIIVASGNKSLNLDQDCSSFPACYKQIYKYLQGKLIVVGAYNVDVGNIGKIVDYYENGRRVGKPVRTGTSQATAIITGKIVSGKLKKRGIVK